MSRVSMGSNGFMGIYVYLWVSMGVYRCLWVSMSTYRCFSNFRVSMGVYG